MPFEIQPLREFLVRPAIPEALSRLEELAYNLYYTWEPMTRSLFRRLDPVLWKNCERNPVLLLGQVSQEALERAAKDPRYLSLYRQTCDKFDAYLRPSEHTAPEKLVAYFSMEYGLVECLPIYSGGLGVLAGDFLKALSDSGEPAVGIGLLYQNGYLQQHLNPDGWQQERYPVNDFYTLPLRPVSDDAGNPLKISVKLPRGPAYAQIWRVDVGRIKLYLLDTNNEDNADPEYRAITAQLYGGDSDARIRQEIVLGIGGLRVLKALGIAPTVFHMNEGHSAFQALERIRPLMQEHGLSFEEAFEAARSGNVFTTHTSVAAGIDLFDSGLMFEYFGEYCREIGIEFEQLMSLGRWNPREAGERFSMAILAFRTSSYRNAVSRLHQRRLAEHVVGAVAATSGLGSADHIDYQRRASEELAEHGSGRVYDESLQPDWRERYDDPKTWSLVDEIPDHELLDVHKRRKRRLISFIREREATFAIARKASASEVQRVSDVLDPDALTIGFARRFATYKRATLLFRDIGRLKRILCNPQRPVQIVVAGNAHPKDHPGKMLIREIVQLSRDPELSKRLVFVEQYGLKVAREMVQGVDLWLNTPRRGEEACGTSGMKAAVNGVLNLSILDGWFDEAYEQSGGWAIGDREPYSEDQDEIHSRALYSLLENDIVPMYYERGTDGMPIEWMRRVRQSIKYLSRQFNCQRTVAEYVSQLYDPSHFSSARIRQDGFSKIRERLRWNSKVQDVWPQVRILDAGHGAEAR